MNSIEEAAIIACRSLLPEKSKERYNQAYEDFIKWCATKDVSTITEDVLLVFFMEKSKKVSPSTLWSEYSMLKLTISLNKNQDISKFSRLKAFIKRKNDGYQPRKSQVFTKEDISKFLLEAPDEIYLMKKVVAIFGVAGACRTDEIYNLKIKDVEYKNCVMLVQILSTKNNVQRRFVVTEDWVTPVNRYMQLRPKKAQDERFFYRYERGRCVNQVVGKHTISKIPYEIAKFLKISNPNLYTGHSFRRTSSTLLANAPGVDILDMKRHGGWKSSQVAEGYIADSVTNKIEVANKILPQTSKSISVQQNNHSETEYIEKQVNISSDVALEQDFNQHLPLNFSGTYNHCSFTFNLNSK